MDPLIGASLIKGVGGIIGGLFGKSSEKRQRSYQIDDQINGPSRMVEGAQKAGLNPLSLLGASSFNYTPNQQTAPLISNAMISNITDTMADAVLNRDAEKREKEKHEIEMERRKLEKERAGGAGGVANRTAGAASIAPRNLTITPKPGVIVKVDSTEPAVPGPIPNNDELELPRLSYGDDSARYESILGVRLPYDAAQRNEDAGGYGVERSHDGSWNVTDWPDPKKEKPKSKKKWPSKTAPDFRMGF